MSPEGTFRNLHFSLFFAMNLIAQGFSRLRHRRSTLCHHFFIASDPRQSPRIGFDFAETCSSGIFSWSLRHVPVETRCQYHKRAARVYLMCHYIKKLSIASNALAKTNPWLTHQQSFGRCFHKVDTMKPEDRTPRRVHRTRGTDAHFLEHE